MEFAATGIVDDLGPNAALHSLESDSGRYLALANARPHDLEMVHYVPSERSEAMDVILVVTRRVEGNPLWKIGEGRVEPTGLRDRHPVCAKLDPIDAVVQVAAEEVVVQLFA